MLRFYVDGATTQVAYLTNSYGVVIPLDYKVTNNEGEYWAVIWALREAVRRDAKYVEILSDSELVVKQLNGEYQVRNPKLLALYQHIKWIVFHNFKRVYFKWIPREENLAGHLLE